MTQRLSTQRIAFIGIILALAAAMEVVFMFLPSLPQGGRISLSLIPIFVLAYKEGPWVGMLGGALFGVINLMLSGFQLYGVWQSLFLDYVFAFGLAGAAGFIFAANKQNVFVFMGGILAGSFLRFLMHYLSGVLLFGAFAPEGTPAALYSLLYNGSYMVPSALLMVLVGALFFDRLKALNSPSDRM